MSKSERLSGKVALVTGASRGIGRAIATRLANEGAFVIINYASNSEEAERVVAEIRASGGAAAAIEARLGSAAETEKLFSRLHQELERRSGKPRLDIIVNNAGLSHFGKLSEATERQYDDLFATNVKAAFLVIKSALKYLADGAHIINISSGASRRPGALLGLYGMTKAAIDTMTLALAAELGSRSVTVNAVAPGWTATEGNAEARKDEATVRSVERQTALGRLGAPDDIARVVALLASDDAGWVTGQVIEASGGFKLL